MNRARFILLGMLIINVHDTYTMFNWFKKKPEKIEIKNDEGKVLGKVTIEKYGSRTIYHLYDSNDQDLGLFTVTEGQGRRWINSKFE
ncbi:MAG: hypothetical protein WA432_05275 [Candidatus Babeliaceae bacterium]